MLRRHFFILKSFVDKISIVFNNILIRFFYIYSVAVQW